MDAIVLLKDDHKTVEALFRRFDPAARAKVPETSGHVLESIEEHHVVGWMLSELKDLDPAGERFTAKVIPAISER
jgi:hypothetical protein